MSKKKNKDLEDRAIGFAISIATAVVTTIIVKKILGTGAPKDNCPQ